MCNKAIGTYHSPMQFVPECYKSQEMFDKAVNTCRFVSDSVPDLYMSQERFDSVAPKEAFV